MSSYHIISLCVQELLVAFLSMKMVSLMVSKNNNPFVRVDLKKNTSLGITVCHHSASLVMPNGDPRHGVFYPTLTLMIDSYNIYHGEP